MHTPARPGEVIDEVVNATGWAVSEATTELGVVEEDLSRLLNLERAFYFPATAAGIDCIRLQ